MYKLKVKSEDTKKFCVDKLVKIAEDWSNRIYYEKKSLDLKTSMTTKCLLRILNVIIYRQKQTRIYKYTVSISLQYFKYKLFFLKCSVVKG